MPLPYYNLPETVITGTGVPGTGTVTGSGTTGTIAKFTSSGAVGDSLLIEGTNTITQRNGTNGQTRVITGTDTDSSNYRQLSIAMSSAGAATISSAGLGTGVSGNSLLLSANGSTVFTIDGTLLTFADAKNLVFNTTTGTKLGTATSQKIGFWNATPIVQPSGTGETVGFTAGAGTPVTDASTFTGNVGATAYRLSDIVKALKNAGLIAA